MRGQRGAAEARLGLGASLPPAWEMCPEEGGAAGLGELPSRWEVPAVAPFCWLFRSAFRLPDFESEVSGREERARWRTPLPFLPCPLGSPGALCGRERGVRGDFGR